MELDVIWICFGVLVVVVVYEIIVVNIHHDFLVLERYGMLSVVSCELR